MSGKRGRVPVPRCMLQSIDTERSQRKRQGAVGINETVRTTIRVSKSFCSRNAYGKQPVLKCHGLVTEEYTGLSERVNVRCAKE